MKNTFLHSLRADWFIESIYIVFWMCTNCILSLFVTHFAPACRNIDNERKIGMHWYGQLVIHPPLVITDICFEPNVAYHQERKTCVFPRNLKKISNKFFSAKIQSTLFVPKQQQNWYDHQEQYNDKRLFTPAPFEQKDKQYWHKCPWHWFPWIYPWLKQRMNHSNKANYTESSTSR